MSELMPVSEVRDCLRSHALPVRMERVDYRDAAGYYLAQDVRADRDVPPFDRAAVDGFAVRLNGVWKDENDFRVLGRIPAGESWQGRLRRGTAVQVMTGAPVPAGADGMVMVERSEWLDEETVRLTGPFDAGASPPGVAPRGEDARKGDVVLEAGMRVEPSHVSILAAMGRVSVPVFRLPEVAVITTGDEVVEPDRRPSRSQIRNSNGPLLGTLLESSRLAWRIRRLRAKDTPASLRRAIDRGRNADVLVLTGGVSMGDRDLVPGLLQESGFSTHLHRIAIRPGKPFLFGTRGRGRARRAAFGLPGNPVSVLVTAWEFLLPYLRAAAGCPRPEPWSIRARSLEEIERKPGLTHFVLGQLDQDDHDAGVRSVRPVPYHGSGDYLAAAWADALIVLPAKNPVAGVGSVCEIHPLFREPSVIPERPRRERNRGGEA